MIRAALAFIGLPPWTFYAIAAALIAAAGAYVYSLGYSSASAKCRTAELERVIYAQAESISRYATALAQSALQREAEAEAAHDRESVIAARVKELEDERVQQEQAATDLEIDLAAAITDKGKLDAIVAKLRTTRNDCRATDRDIDVDNRMRRKR